MSGLRFGAVRLLGRLFTVAEATAADYNGFSVTHPVAREASMAKKRIPNFTIGLLIGTLVALLVWYWQKATSAEDGALDLLNRHAAAEARLRELEQSGPGRAQPSAPMTYDGPADDLTQILGIGPTYSQRLHDAGIHTYAALGQQTPDHVREITGISLKRTAEAAEWIGDARRLAG